MIQNKQCRIRFQNVFLIIPLYVSSTILPHSILTFHLLFHATAIYALAVDALW